MLSAKIVAQNPAGSVSSAVPVVQAGGAAEVAEATVSGRESPPLEQRGEQERGREAARDASGRAVVHGEFLLGGDEPERQEAGP